MIIACPSCGARFNLDPAKLLPAGRNVRCAKCSHRWRQMPEGMAAPPEPSAVPEPPQPEVAPFPPSSASPEFAAAMPAPPEETESLPPRPPETPAEMAQPLAAIAEQVTGARPEGTAAEEAAQDGAGEDAAADRAADREADDNPIARLARRAQPEVADPSAITAPPRMKPLRPAKRASHLWLVLAAGLVVGLLIAGYVFRDVIARTVPGADIIYSLLRIPTDNAAADLEISIDNARINTNVETGRKIFDLTATVFNLSQEPLSMPPLVVIPVDDVGSPMPPLTFRLAESVIEPGQNIKFRKSFEDWPPTAPNFELRVATAE